MAPFPLQKHAIAGGHNVALNLLNLWEHHSVSGRYFLPVRSWGNYRKGIIRLRQDGKVARVGDPSTAWDWLCYHTQYKYLSTAYCNNDLTGNVTIYTITDTPNTFVRLNAILRLPDIPDIAWRGRQTQQLIRLEFSRLETPS